MGVRKRADRFEFVSAREMEVEASLAYMMI